MFFITQDKRLNYPRILINETIDVGLLMMGNDVRAGYVEEIYYNIYAPVIFKFDNSTAITLSLSTDPSQHFANARIRYEVLEKCLSPSYIAFIHHLS